MATLAERRHQMILDAVRADGEIAVNRLARRLSVSGMTVRRDLAGLEDRGLLVRVRGGAMAAAPVRFDERLAARSAAKARAAKKLESLLPETGTIYLDGSTTMLHLVPALRRARGLQVATNNAETFRRLVTVPGVEPLLIGGRLDRRTDNLVGPLAMRSLLAVVFDAAFFSAWGLDAAVGPTEATIEDAEVKDLVASRSRAVRLAVDDSKFGLTAAGAWRPDSGRTVLATNLPPADGRLAAFRKGFASIV